MNNEKKVLLAVVLILAFIGATATVAFTKPLMNKPFVFKWIK